MSDVQTIYANALETLVAKLRTDTTIVAAVLLGSLAYDTVWERSDIDLLVVTDEAKLSKEGVCLVEAGVNIHCTSVTRSQFRKVLEGSAHGSFLHSMLGKGRILFSKDETLIELFETRHVMGERDRAAQLTRRVSQLLPAFTKAEKWFHAKRDYDYCFLWLMKCVDSLASLELLLHGEVPSREVVQRALQLNPELFRAIYTDLIHSEPTPQQLEQALKQINAYLHANGRALFGILIEYLREEGGVRSATELNHYFERNWNLEGVDMACEWLADEGIIEKLAVPVRLTTKSRVDMEEAAYYFSGENDPWP